MKIIGEGTDLFAQGYFVYDSKKSGSVTVSHLRFGPRADPLDLPGRRRRLRRLPPVRAARQDEGPRAREARARPSCSTPRTARTRSGSTCPASVQRQLDRQGDRPLGRSTPLAVADEAGMGSRINTVMQPCFFQLAGVLPPDEAIARIKAFVEKTYAQARRGRRRAQLRRHRPLARRASAT